MGLELLQIAGLISISIGIFLNPIRNFNALRFVAFGLSLFFVSKFGFISVFLASLLFLFNSRRKLIRERLFLIIPYALILWKPKLLENLVLKIIPSQQKNALEIGIIAVSLILYLVLRNLKYFKRKMQ